MDGVRAFVASRGARGASAKPHRVFANWSSYFSLPWVCFIDIAVFCLYLLFAYYHQASTIAFTLDFSQTISAFFLDGIDLPDPPIGIPVGDGQVYYRRDFESVLNTTCLRFFRFPNAFPIAYPFLAADRGWLTTRLFNGTLASVPFNESSAAAAAASVQPYVETFSTVEAVLGYHIQVTGETHDARLTLTIRASFTHDNDTGTVFMDISHTRVQEKFELTGDMLLVELDFSLPILIAALNVAGIVGLVRYVFQMVEFAVVKAADNLGNWRMIFWRKFDKWSFFAFITHALSIAACVLYMIKGRDITQNVPPFLSVFSAATVCHSLLLIRYLQLKDSTMLIVTVFYKSAVKIVQFLVGCLPIYIGFLAFGVCFFGHLNPYFATAMEMAVFLFCSMHGDSLRDMYDATMVQSDMSVYVGFIFVSLWLAFSLLIMFNITISIVQEVLEVETEKQEAPREDPAFRSLAVLPAHLHTSLPLG
jgi:hypothetical protein